LTTNIIDLIESQVIVSIKDQKDIEKAIESPSNIVFLLTGNLLTIQEHIQILQNANKKVFLHIDFIDGLSNTKSAIEYIAKHLKPLGIITTKSNLIKFAKEVNLLAIQRIFLIDGGAVTKGIEMVKSCKPDAVEVLPGLMPRVIFELTETIETPLIVGGLISSKEEILSALKAGALAVSVGNSVLWNFDF
jgi:glycerol uptake operon antiterminator